ncbi:hypothetical protein [Nocardioides stalactiti]|uniref:hypothetical protein n=1 Tax=Nocardioides stalactiti TaxID=2755356 RepID=UPI001600ACE4|nr:hypothetical protein [Nocardioides stalactiti]
MVGYGGRKRGWGRIIGGVLGIVLLAVPMLIGALVILVGVARWESFDPEAQGRVPGVLTLDADEGTTYVVALGTGIKNETGGGRSFNTSFAVDIRCTIRHPDGTEDTIRGDRQTSSVERAGDYASIGRFEGAGGTTEVDCTSTSKDVFGDELDLPAIVHATNATLQWVAWGLLLGSVAVVLGGVGLIVWGVRGKVV